MSSSRRWLPAAAVLVVLAGCGSDSGDATKLARGLRTPLEHAYGRIDSITCKKNDQVTLPGGSTAYDCTATLASGRRQPLCAGFVKGVPAFEHTTCARTSFPRR
jgi:hypothetical protein